MLRKKITSPDRIFAQKSAPFPTWDNTIAGRITAGFPALLTLYILVVQQGYIDGPLAPKTSSTSTPARLAKTPT